MLINDHINKNYERIAKSTFKTLNNIFYFISAGSGYGAIRERIKLRKAFQEFGESYEKLVDGLERVVGILEEKLIEPEALPEDLKKAFLLSPTVAYEGMEPKNLETLLDFLPQPHYVSFHLNGAYPPNALQQPQEIPQLKEIYQDRGFEVKPLVTLVTSSRKGEEKLSGYSGLSVLLQEPKKDLVLNIHTKWYHSFVLIKYLKSTDPSLRGEKMTEISEIDWDLGDGAEVRVRPNYSNVVYLSYRGEQEPPSISQIRNKLSKTSMRFERLKLDKQFKQ